MSVLLVVGIGLLVVVVAALVLLALGGSREWADEEPLTSVGVTVLRRARHRGLVCLGLALVVLVAGLTVNAAVPGLLGLPLGLAPGLAATCALLGYAVLPSRVAASGGTASASLVPRTAWTYGSRRAFVVPAALTVATLAFLGWAALVADADEQGRMRTVSFTDGPVTASAGPFPGSFYALPLALGTIVLALSTYLALRQVSGTPTLPTVRDAAADRGWRTASTSLVSLVASAALLGGLGGAAFFAGHAVRSAAGTIVANGGRTPAALVPAGTTLALVGAALVLAAVLAAVLAVRRALTLSSPPAAAATAPLASLDRR